MTQVYELKATHDNRKIFYGKAHVIREEDGTLKLQSYNTIVAEISPEGKLTINGWYSTTTARHINEFLQEHGFPSMSKKEMVSYGNV